MGDYKFEIKSNGQRMIGCIHSPVLLRTKKYEFIFGLVYLTIPVFLITKLGYDLYRGNLNQNNPYPFSLTGLASLYLMTGLIEFIFRYFTNRYHIKSTYKITHSFVKTVNHFINKTFFMKLSTFRNHPKWDIIFFRTSYAIITHSVLFCLLNFSLFFGGYENLDYLGEELKAEYVSVFDNSKLNTEIVLVKENKSNVNRSIATSINTRINTIRIKKEIIETKAARLLALMTGIVGFIGLMSWQLYTRKGSQYKGCLDSYNDIIKDISNDKVSRNSIELRSVSLCIDLLHVDLWAHKSFSELFTTHTMKAFNRLYEDDSRDEKLISLGLVSDENAPMLREENTKLILQSDFYKRLNDGKVCVDQVGSLFDYYYQDLVENLHAA
ncbi:hypothetical protein [Halobacteriovorax sp. JY17]|uniref:hypothetical protein n=1 Tax=Halobacteriovorax sp. JY17 TaxID=2014617 RepID=UPI000C355ADC|nr:hypothetical protein [Halobacteriovorax sp. JY17]PIK13551.1 MAG: hypothetical protein CES88_15280 [Halobacteriovorax sp. JY17]